MKESYFWGIFLPWAFVGFDLVYTRKGLPSIAIPANSSSGDAVYMDKRVFLLL